jgi:hypothetical protein
MAIPQLSEGAIQAIADGVPDLKAVLQCTGACLLSTMPLTAFGTGVHTWLGGVAVGDNRTLSMPKQKGRVIHDKVDIVPYVVASHQDHQQVFLCSGIHLLAVDLWRRRLLIAAYAFTLFS